MTFTGHIVSGQIVPDIPLALPDGAVIRCEVVPAAPASLTPVGPRTTLRERLKNFLSHTIDDLPPDAAENHDHYLYDRQSDRPLP